MSNMADGLNMQPRIGEPESSIAGTQALAGSLSAVAPLSMPDTSGPGPTPLQAPAAWVYDFDPGTGTSRATFNGEVSFLTGGSATAGVTSWNGETGAVVMTSADIVAAGGLANPSPTLAGVPNAPTAAPGTNTTQIATTMFVTQAVNAGAGVSTFNGRGGAVTLTTGDITGAGGAPSVSPALTGTPTAPTAAQGDTSSQIATDAFVSNAIAAGTVTTFNGRRGAVALTLSDVQSVGGAPIASPNFTGTPAGPTAAPGAATTQLATTAFVANAVTAGTAGVSSVNTRTGAVVLNASDLTAMGGAPLNSPVLTGNPAAPTPSAGDNSTKIATTAYVETAIGSLPSGVSTFNGRTGTVTLALADVTSVGGAPLASPTFTGSPLSTTPAPLDNSTRIATTAFVGAALPAASTTTPLMDGTAAVGTGTTWARSNHVHPTDTSRYSATNPSGFQTAAQVSASLGNYLPLSGGTITGGVLNVESPSNPIIQLLGGVGQALGQFYYSSTDSNVYVTNAAGVNNIGLATGGDITVTPAGGHNFLLQVGAGYQSGGGPWSSLSDARIKNELGNFEAGLDELTQLRPVVYTYKGNDAIEEGARSIHADAATSGQEFVGLIAQEVEAIFPGMVGTREGYIDSEPVNDLRTLNTGPITFALINAVKELKARVEALEGALSSAGSWRG